MSAKEFHESQRCRCSVPNSTGTLNGGVEVCMACSYPIEATAAEGMAKVLDEHWGCISSSGGTATEWTFSCGVTVRLDAPGSYAEFHRVHVADALAAAGYGSLADAWDEGRSAGVSSESIYGGLDDRDQDNPYRSQP